MTDYADYLAWLADGGWIRVSARAIIFNAARDRILVEQNHWVQHEFFNFIGGGLELNEALQECIARELSEETDAQIMDARYLFVVERFFPRSAEQKDEMRHSLEHYFEIELHREEVVPDGDGVEFRWLPIGGLGGVDLRPWVVRDVIADGSYARVKHMVLREDGRDGS